MVRSGRTFVAGVTGAGAVPGPPSVVGGRWVIVAARRGGLRCGRSDGRAVRPVAQDAQPPVLLVPGYGGGTAASSGWPPALRRDGPRRDRRAPAPATAPATSTSRPACSTAPSGRARGGRRLGRRRRLLRRRRDRPALGRATYDGGVGGPPDRHPRLAAARHRPRRARRATSRPARARPPAGSWRPTATCSAALNRGDETPAGPRWVSIWTTDDQVSTPPETRLARRARSTSPCSRSARVAQVTHGQLPTDPAVIGDGAGRARRTARQPSRRRLLGAGGRQAVMSLVTKFAQAAPRNTTT